MKKIRLIGMFALTFALVFGAVSCKNETEEGPWGDSLAEVLKEEKSTKFLEADWLADEDDTEVDVTITLGGEEIDYATFMQTDDKWYLLETANFEKKIEKDSAVGYFTNWVAREAAIEKEYKDGPVTKDGKTTYSELAVMINGDRDAIRIEMYSEYTGKYGGANGPDMEESGTLAVTYNKKK